MDSLGGEVIRLIDTEGDYAEWTFPADPGAVRAARSAVRARLRGWDLDSVGDLTALLVSELVTNALRHATGPIGVRLVRPADLGGVLLVEVSDPLPEFPHERVARPDDEGGRGLQDSWNPPPAAGAPGPAARARPCGSNSRCRDEARRHRPRVYAPAPPVHRPVRSGGRLPKRGFDGVSAG
ncbi:hypothetical protein SGRIM128S_06231 [Streptomyces griseomycini]